jgi:hypothetical protein
MHTSLNSHEFLLGGDTPINRLRFWRNAFTL